MQNSNTSPGKNQRREATTPHTWANTKLTSNKDGPIHKPHFGLADRNFQHDLLSNKPADVIDWMMKVIAYHKQELFTHPEREKYHVKSLHQLQQSKYLSEEDVSQVIAGIMIDLTETARQELSKFLSLREHYPKNLLHNLKTFSGNNGKAGNPLEQSIALQGHKLGARAEIVHRPGGPEDDIPLIVGVGVALTIIYAVISLRRIWRRERPDAPYMVPSYSHWVNPDPANGSSSVHNQAVATIRNELEGYQEYVNLGIQPHVPQAQQEPEYPSEMVPTPIELGQIAIQKPAGAWIRYVGELWRRTKTQQGPAIRDIELGELPTIVLPRRSLSASGSRHEGALTGPGLNSRAHSGSHITPHTHSSSGRRSESAHSTGLSPGGFGTRVSSWARRDPSGPEDYQVDITEHTRRLSFEPTVNRSGERGRVVPGHLAPDHRMKDE